MKTISKQPLSTINHAKSEPVYVQVVEAIVQTITRFLPMAATRETGPAVLQFSF